jgi:hypothetical protein
MQNKEEKKMRPSIEKSAVENDGFDNIETKSETEL